MCKGFTVACLFLVSLQLNSQLVIDYFKINGGLCSVVRHLNARFNSDVFFSKLIQKITFVKDK